MKLLKTVSFAFGLLLLGNSLVAMSGALQNSSARPHRPTEMEQAFALAVTRHIDPENTEIFIEERPEISLSDVAKTLTLEAGIPLILRQNSYARLALYPYLWWYKGARTATEELMVDSIKCLASYITGRQELIDCSQSGKGCKISKFATTVALDIALRSYIVKPCTDKLFGSEQQE